LPWCGRRTARDTSKHQASDRKGTPSDDVRDVSKFTSVVDEQTPGNVDDTMIINTGQML